MTVETSSRLPALLLGIGGSAALLAYFLLRGPYWEQVALVAATLLPAGLVLYGADARRRAIALREQQALTERTLAATEAANASLKGRLAELTTLNELGVAVASTLDLDRLVDLSLETIVRHLRFDRALILLVDPEGRTLGQGRSVGGSPEMAALVAGLETPIEGDESLLAQLALADGPMLFEDVDEDPYEPNRQFAAALEVTSFLGTPLVTKSRTVGVLAVDNRVSGRDLSPNDGPLLYTLGSLIAGAIENAGLYAEVEAQKAELERRVAQRTAALAGAIEEAQAARATAEAASETKSHFLSNVSHELRTPLTSVIGFTKLVRKRLEEVLFPLVPADAVAADPKVERAMRQVAENLGIMVAEGERLTTLINDVLDLAKIEAGRLEWRDGPVAIPELVGRATAATAALFEQTELELVVDVPEDLPQTRGDRDRLIQVLINLLSNAVKFTPTGTVTVSARLATPGEIEVAVADSGIGIAPADHEKVWEQFG
ncbi:MAG TPA: histidine kinase dimerization/phospho-acceptor domain-containing protein, partial [Candidatus Limnocylindrales bacterium]|nr:histidine kinase dimerization/phospho-acceptor domain-containing protein [Candidatus Limnocylindrales bacterium]